MHTISGVWRSFIKAEAETDQNGLDKWRISKKPKDFAPFGRDPSDVPPTEKPGGVGRIVGRGHVGHLMDFRIEDAAGH